MEEKKNQKPQQKLSYDELNKVASDIHMQYQKLMNEHMKLTEAYNNAVEALKNKDFDYTSFFIQMLFKVLEHPEMYNSEFVSWCSNNIESAIKGFDESLRASDKEEEPKDEAE